MNTEIRNNIGFPGMPTTNNGGPGTGRSAISSATITKSGSIGGDGKETEDRNKVTHLQIKVEVIFKSDQTGIENWRYQSWLYRESSNSRIYGRPCPFAGDQPNDLVIHFKKLSARKMEFCMWFSRAHLEERSFLVWDTDHYVLRMDQIRFHKKHDNCKSCPVHNYFYDTEDINNNFMWVPK